MAETNNPTGGESTTNTTTSTTGGTTGTAGRGNTTTNLRTSTGGGDATGGGSTGLSSANTPDADLQNEETQKALVVEKGSLLPYPHSALAGIKTEASAYKDLIKDVYKEHEKAMESDKPHEIELSDEMIAARDDAQARLSEELRATLKAQRSMTRKAGADEGSITIKLSKPHIHSGVPYEAGDEIKVDEVSANFIEDSKVGKRA
jgi:hypothetical protein